MHSKCVAFIFHLQFLRTFTYTGKIKQFCKGNTGMQEKCNLASIDSKQRVDATTNVQRSCTNNVLSNEVYNEF